MVGLGAILLRHLRQAHKLPPTSDKCTQAFRRPPHYVITDGLITGGITHISTIFAGCTNTVSYIIHGLSILILYTRLYITPSARGRLCTHFLSPTSLIQHPFSRSNKLNPYTIFLGPTSLMQRVLDESC